jgi:lipopolysaccharide transport system ATP-binding protein
MSDIAIRVENLGKRYRIGRKRADTLMDALPRLFSRNEQDHLWALKDVSFEVKRGEVVGIIGRNGAGKSTLLKILSRITEPTEGRAVLHGRVGSLLEVGTGFHPDLTGRENIYFNGSILGMRKREIDRKFDEIVAFAEVEPFLDTPVKHYSSGMYMRLAFAVAAHLDPEILLVDEVLAVGDFEFQRKCLGKIDEVSKEGRTVLFVSHNLAAVANLCRRGMVLHRGEMERIGTPSEAIAAYLGAVQKKFGSLRGRTDRQGSGKVRVVEVEFRDIRGNAIDRVLSGQSFDIYLHFEAEVGCSRSDAIASVHFKTWSEVPVFLLHNRLTRDHFGPLPVSGAFVCRINRLPLPSSTYRITISVIMNGEYLDRITDAAELMVVEGDYFGSGEVPSPEHGLCLVDGAWRLDSARA